MIRVLYITTILIQVFFLCIFQFTASAQEKKDTLSPEKGNSYALVVGVNKYPYINGASLPFAEDDAMLFYDYLVKSGVCEKGNIDFLSDSLATMPIVYSHLGRLKNRIGPNDTVIFYFAGHGDVETDLQSGYLLTQDCNATNYSASAIDISKLEKFINAYAQKGAKVLMVVDACRSGNLAGGLDGARSTMNAFLVGFAQADKLLSCQPSELSEERVFPEGGHGVFTYHLVDGLRGLADKNNDGSVTVRELDLYLEKVAEQTNNKQNPKVEGDPKSKVLHFEASQKTALLSKKQSLSSLPYRVSRGASLSNDTSVLFRRFEEYIRQGNLIDPPKTNAYALIKEAEKNRAPKDQIEELKIVLSALLENAAQKWLHLYINGDERKMKNFYSQESFIKNVRLMDSCLALVSEQDIRYNEIKAKALFFKGYYLYRRDGINSAMSEALSVFEKADKLLPNQPWILNGMANALHYLKRDDLAEVYYQKASALSPKWRVPLDNLASAYLEPASFDQKKSEKEVTLLSRAEALFKQSLIVDSFNTSFALAGLGEVYMKSNKNEEAKKYLESAIGEDSTDTHTLELIYKLYFTKSTLQQLIDTPKTVSFIKQIIMANPTATSYWVLLRTLKPEMDRNEVVSAIEKLKKTTVEEPANTNAWQAMGVVQSCFEKNLIEAEKCFLLALKYDSSAENHYNLACLYALNKNQTPAVFHLKKAIEKGFVNCEALKNDPDLSSIKELKEYKELIKKHCH